MKKQVKIITTILMVIMILTTLAGPIFATGDNNSRSLLDGLNGNSTVSTGKIQNFGNAIIGVVRVVGVVVAVVVLLVIGIKYMLGSAEEKAEYKKTMVPYVVGAIVLFAATAIVGIVYDLSNNLNT